MFCYPCYVLCREFLPILTLSRSFFSNLGQGPLPIIAGKSPEIQFGWSIRGLGGAICNMPQKYSWLLHFLNSTMETQI